MDWQTDGRRDILFNTHLNCIVHTRRDCTVQLSFKSICWHKFVFSFQKKPETHIKDQTVGAACIQVV